MFESTGTHNRLPGYPIELQLDGCLVTVIGAGQVARRKLPALLASGAQILLVDPAPEPGLPQQPQITLKYRNYLESDLDGAWLVFAATSDPQINTQVAQDARKRRIPCCRVDNATDSGFTTPARLHRPPLGLSVSTSGSCPALASVFRDLLDEKIPGSWQAATLLLAAVRRKSLTDKLQVPYNQQVLLQLIEEGLLDQLTQGDQAGIERLLEQFFGTGFSLKGLQLSLSEGIS